MSNILIIADGEISKKFIDRLIEKRVSNHNYIVITKEIEEYKQSSFIEYIAVDATSIYRLREVCREDRFSALYIVVENMSESKEIYKNIRSLNKKVRVVAFDSLDCYKDVDDLNLNSVDMSTIISNRLYDFLPSVPVTAQTIGLNEGEIMEVNIPFSSIYAFRYISSIPQIKWRIVAIYRDNKLFLPTNATMIRPRDRLLLVGKPQVLSSVYGRINSKNSKFPEPFGKNFYLYLDIDKDSKRALEYIDEAIYMLDKFDDKELIIRVVNPNNFDIVNKIKEYESVKTRVFLSYVDVTEGDIETDIQNFEIGMIFLSESTLSSNSFSKKLYAYKKLVYIFGNSKLSQIKEATVIKSGSKELEEISSIAFYIAETLGVKLSLREYEPDGKFAESRVVAEHYETLAQVHNVKLEIVQEKRNPIKATKGLQSVLVVIPFRRDISFNGFISLFKRDIDSLLLKTNNHPKLLISTEQ